LSKIRVYIPTTDGPVAVERIAREPAAQSVVCVKRTTRVLPISAAYDAFVRAPSGVIERELGPFESGAFRLDVSGRIGDGESWQLGVYLAHALAVEGRLAGPDDACTQAVWATGAVDGDLRISAVGHVPEKIHLSQELNKALSDEGIALTAFVPGDNLDAATATSADFEIQAAQTTREILATLGPAQPAAAAPSSEVATTAAPAQTDVAVPAQSGTVVLWVLLGLAAFVGAAYFLYQDGKKSVPVVAVEKTPVQPAQAEPGPVKPAPVEPAPIKQKAAPKPEPTPTVKAAPKAVIAPPGFGVAELRAPQGVTCAAIQFDEAKPEIVPLSRGADARFPDSRVAGLCGLEFSVDPGSAERFAKAVVTVKRGKFVKGERLPDVLTGTTPLKGPLTWRVFVPKRLSSALEYTIGVQFSDQPIGGAAAPSLTAEHRITP